MWLMLMVIYAAPADAVDWDGPWSVGMTQVPDRHYASEAECRNDAIQIIGRLHQSMLAPARFRCVEVDATLPKGAAR
jgi:hypothetical protein